MVLHNIEKNIFKWLGHFHFYLRPLPLQWNENFTEIYIMTPYFKYFGPYAFALFFTSFYAVSSFCVGLYLNFWTNAEMIEVLVQFLMCGVFGIVCCVFIPVILNLNALLLAFNGMLKMASEIEKAYRPRQRDKMDFSSVLLYCISPLIASGILIIPPTFVATGLETFQYIAEVLLGDPKFRSNYTIIGTILLRYLISMLACVETFRSIAYAYIFLLILLDRWKSILITPVIYCRNASELCTTHIHYRLLTNAIQNTLEHLTYMLVNGIFWGLVFTSWICVKSSPEDIGYILYAWFVFVTCLLSLLIAFFLTLFCNLLDLDSLAVQVNILRAKKCMAQNRTWQNKIVFRRTIAVRSIRLKYGLFDYVSSDFFVEFVEVLLDRIFDAIVTFDY